jgi:ATP-binding cassette subfamily B protein/subfamily B ATP-binding cassette protein MsbA
VILVLSAASAALAALQPLPMKLFVDNALGGEPVTGLPQRALDRAGIDPTRRNLSIVAAVATFVATVGAAALSSVVNVLWESTGTRMVRSAMVDVFDRLQRLSGLYHARHHVGDSMSRIGSDTSAVYTATNSLLLGPATQLLTIATVLWSATRLDARFAVFALGLAAVLVVLSQRLGGVLRSRAAEARGDQVGMVSFVTQVVHGLPVVQTFTAEDRNLDHFRTLAARSVVSSRRTTVAEVVADATLAVVAAAGSAVVLVVGGRAVERGDLSIGDLLVFMAYARTLDVQMRGLLGTLRRLRLADVGLDRLAEVLDSDVAVADPSRPVGLPLPGELRDQGGRWRLVRTRAAAVAIEGVTFGYEAGRPVLHDVDLVAEPGRTVALVGHTGAGKSTLVSLVPRFFDPWSGRVLLDGVDLRDARVDAVRRRVALVRQDPLLLPLSIGDNIAYGRPGASRGEIEAAARQAQVASFVERLPDGYDTVVGELGVTLSGGERQRVAIARALLKDAPVLILDEPTAALDAESEALLTEALDRVCANRTVLVIAHRLSTVRRADHIVVLEDGRVVEQGNDAELQRAGGRYSRFHRLQFAGSG